MHILKMIHFLKKIQAIHLANDFYVVKVIHLKNASYLKAPYILKI